ncbi:type II toxin-antitoxin system VapB family antitoxin [Microvirga alba]|uniref:Type II toxin-antitoxin system VapB family antitoxin n=1 Tax=Microvirga alba TaxID=2791025 RepID=A0A931BZE7_9HYPH|nr:type II toxin-antitoxin system VapB family antitoxin [Microvirga alba]MBF9235622.1 type II toxin-antitoxin system VapB family antitoxin [Microvirga alba]
MAYHIKDEAVLQALEQLHKRRGLPKAEILRRVLKHELDGEIEKVPVRERLAPLLAKVAAVATIKPATWEDDKRLSDELWGE